MKVTLTRASSRLDEYEADLNIPETLVEQLLSVGKEIPIEENTISWDSQDDKSTTFILSINPETKEVEIMIYDYYVE